MKTLSLGKDYVNLSRRILNFQNRNRVMACHLLYVALYLAEEMQRCGVYPEIPTLYYAARLGIRELIKSNPRYVQSRFSFRLPDKAPHFDEALPDEREGGTR